MDPLNIPAKLFEVRSLPIPEIIGGTPKIWAVPVYAHVPFSIDPVNIPAKSEVRSFNHS